MTVGSDHQSRETGSSRELHRDLDAHEPERESKSVFGRSRELAAGERFLHEIQRGPSVLVLGGEVGAGKTTLWKAIVSAGRKRGYRVLVSHPAESEQPLPFVGLGDLLGGVVEDPLLQLPLPQERALKVALVMEDPDGPPPDQLAVSIATLRALRSISERSPVLIAVDDLQWMDRPSARVIEFVIRRLGTERVGLVAAVRFVGRGMVPTWLDVTLSGAELHRLTVEPLDAEALDSLLQARLGERLARPVLHQVQATSAGNPLFALELARAILRGEVQPKTGERLSVPSTLQQFVRQRLAHLPSHVRDILVIAAAVSDPTTGLLEAAVQRPASVHAALEAAIEAEVVEVSEDRVRFVHPLFASTLYHAVSPKARRALHRKLARLIHGTDERARHLALGADGPDPEVAAALDRAARGAAARGAPDAAAEVAEQAYELTHAEDDVGRERRRIEAAEYHFAAGNLERARQILEEAAAALAPGPARASVLRRLAKVRYRNDSCSVAAQLLTRALAEAGEEGALRALIERDLAWAVMLCGDMQEAADHAGSALRLVEASGNNEMLAEIVAATAMATFLQGGGLPSSAMRRSVELERLSPQTPIEWRPSMMLAMMLKWSGDTSSARHRFDDLYRHALEAGEETSLPFLLAQMSETATREGDWKTGLRQAEDAATMALQTGQEPMMAAALYARALVQAHLGDVDDARASARAGLELSEKVGSVVMMMWNQTVLGFVELSLDDPVAAHAYLAPLVAWLDVVGIREPGVLHFVPEEVEALVALGELEKADALLTSYEADATRLQRTWALLAAARCRALHTAASGDSTGAAHSLHAALDQHGAEAPPFERARTLLVLGSVQRRTRRRLAARRSLEAALETFDTLGAVSWSGKARRMLGGRAAATDRERGPQLTPSELRVAQAVAAGATNREAADRLFVTTRTVELHLTSVYRKLGIRSRTELALRMAKPIPPPRHKVAGRPQGPMPVVDKS